MLCLMQDIKSLGWAGINSCSDFFLALISHGSGTLSTEEPGQHIPGLEVMAGCAIRRIHTSLNATLRRRAEVGVSTSMHTPSIHLHVRFV